MALSTSDIRKAAERLGVDPCAVRAVIDIESGGIGFNPDGRVKIQFEGHVFYRELKKRGIDPREYQPGNADILYPAFTTRYVLGQSAEYRQLEKAADIHAEAALLSTSWGMFQIMGFNHRACGFDDVRSFVEAQKEGEARQLESFCAFMRAEGLVLFLVGRDWAGFARRYNGPAYAENRYDVKLRQAYQRCQDGEGIR